MEFCGSQWRLIAFLLLLATIQCVRADFLKNETFIDWHAYSEGTVALPYQGKVPIMPILRWAGHSVDGIASVAGMVLPLTVLAAAESDDWMKTLAIIPRIAKDGAARLGFSCSGRGL
jgi:hypothetical protein